MISRAGALRLLAPVAILAAAAAGFLYLQETRPQTPPQALEERVWTVATVPAVAEDVRPEIKSFGEIFAGRQVELRPLVEGRVVETGDELVEGGVVAEGELLIAIDPFEYRNIRDEREAQLEEARARLAEIQAERAGAVELRDRDREQVELRRRDVERRERLAKDGVTSEKALDDVRLALSEARQQAIQRTRDIAQLASRIDQQTAVIERLELQLAQAARDLAQTRLTAPFPGFLVDVNTQLGKRVSRADAVARLIDSGRLEVRFHLSDEDFGRLLLAGEWRGRAIRVEWRAGEAIHTFTARIDRVQGEVDPARGGAELFARIDHAAPETPLRPGAFVEVWVEGRHYADVVRIPERALHPGPKVFLAEDGRLGERKVEVVARTGNDILIRGPFNPGAKIVTTRFPEMIAGLKVKVP